MRLQQIASKETYTSSSLSRTSWPDAVAYREAIQTPHASLADPILQSSGIQLDRRGLPVAYAGRFAIVFRLVGENGDVWAFRCFTTPGEENGKVRESHYKVIQKYVDEHRAVFVPFRYIERGIKVGRNWYPALAMRWAEGEPLGRWVEKNVHNAEGLRQLCGSLTNLLLYLESSGIAHGDWQHDNLLIANNGEFVTLVDYDGMYVPEFEGQRSPELGHPNYQHPARTAEHFNVGLDRFSCLAIQTALLALAQEPSLWDRYSDGESLLFKREDFVAPSRSPLFQELRAIAELSSDETLADAIARLEDACSAGAMSSLLPVVEATEAEWKPAETGRTYKPIASLGQIPAVGPFSSAQAVTARLESGKVGPWWMMPEVVTRTRTLPSPTLNTKTKNTAPQRVSVMPHETFTFIERANSEAVQQAEEKHLVSWRLGGMLMVVAIAFVIGMAITLRNAFLPLYFAWLLAYASLGFEKWPRRVVYEELNSEIKKIEDLIARRNEIIVEKGGITASVSGVSNVGEYITEKLRHTSINQVLTIPNTRVKTLRMLRKAGIENALQLRSTTQIEGMRQADMDSLQSWVREREAEAANEYRKMVGTTRSAPGEVSRLRHEVAEFERHVAQLKRERDLFPDVSWGTYWRKLLNQEESPTSSSTTTP
ncbi:MAG: hypothetical protein OHK0029_09790 [Armatimonadaceae bacterium]